MNRSRRRGHRETPIVVGLAWLFCTFGVGFATIARDGNRAAKVGLVLEPSEKLASFARGCAWGTAMFLAMIAAVIVIFLVSFWLENWREKRIVKRKNKQ